MNEKCFISVVIPCYRSENTIEIIVNSVLDELKSICNEYEVVLVNDCSPDGVWDSIGRLCEQDSHVIGINFTRNFGQHAALLAGFNEASGDIVASMDDDGQTNPKELKKLIDKLNEGYDVVFARYPKSKENLFRRFGSWINRKTAESLIHKPKNIYGTSYFVAKNYIIKDIIKYNKPYPYVGGLIFRSTQNIGEVEIEHKERIEGNSGYSIAKLIKLYMNGFTAFSVKPLRLASFLGFVIAVVGFVYGIIIVVKRLNNTITEIGYASILASLLFVGGIIMILLGLLGEYIGRIYISINNSPQYVIKEIKKKK